MNKPGSEARKTQTILGSDPWLSIAPVLSLCIILSLVSLCGPSRCFSKVEVQVFGLQAEQLKLQPASSNQQHATGDSSRSSSSNWNNATPSSWVDLDLTKYGRNKSMAVALNDSASGQIWNISQIKQQPAIAHKSIRQAGQPGGSLSSNRVSLRPHRFLCRCGFFLASY